MKIARIAAVDRIDIDTKRNQPAAVVVPRVVMNWLAELRKAQLDLERR